MPDYTMMAPGVYIEEQTATGPIAGVSTSVAAFIGPTAQGPLEQAVLVTNWTQFKTQFGGYLPDSYMAHAVRGFFDNGGTLAYIVRVGAGAVASLDLHTTTILNPPQTALRVLARQEGIAGNAIGVTVTHTHIVSTTQQVVVTRANAAITVASQQEIELTDEEDAKLFVRGDTITIEGTEERATISYIDSGDDEKAIIHLSSSLSGTYSSGTVRIADLVTDQQTLRISTTTGIEQGSVIRLEQTQTVGVPPEYHTVANIVGNLVTLADGLLNGYSLAETSHPVTIITEEFTLTIQPPPDETEEQFANLSMNSEHSRYFLNPGIINSKFIELANPQVPDLLDVPGNEPNVVSTHLVNGKNRKVTNISPGDYETALGVLAKVTDVSLVCVPGCTNTVVQAMVVADCERTNRFALLDGVRTNTPLQTNGPLENQRGDVLSVRGYAALYYPWITIADPVAPSGQTAKLQVPPSGHLAGIFARSDSQRGVHKAPANELITGAIGLEHLLDDREQGMLNSWGINVLRIFPGQTRPIVWGARTTAPKAELPWRFINVRRLFIFIEESIQRGIRWAVFEPNSVTLWKQLDRTITEFLTRVWASGALVGNSAAEAFYVKIDDELNTPALQALGQVVIEVGIAPVRPAEFVIVRISMWSGNSTVSEG